MLALFEGEFGPARTVAALERIAEEQSVAAAVSEQAGEIVRGVIERREELDREIGRLAPAIPVAELGRVERTILRSAIWEVLYSAATPSGEAIHDAVSLARIYAGDAARRLVNGVLGSVSRSSGGGA
jgi:transcription antitermination protein NusB